MQLIKLLPTGESQNFFALILDTTKYFFLYISNITNLIDYKSYPNIEVKTQGPLSNFDLFCVKTRCTIGNFNTQPKGAPDTIGFNFNIISRRFSSIFFGQIANFTSVIDRIKSINIYPFVASSISNETEFINIQLVKGGKSSSLNYIPDITSNGFNLNFLQGVSQSVFELGQNLVGRENLLNERVALYPDESIKPDTISNFLAFFIDEAGQFFFSKTFIIFGKNSYLECSDQRCKNYPGQNLTALFPGIINSHKMNLFFHEPGKRVLFAYETFKGFAIRTIYIDGIKPLFTISNITSFDISNSIDKFYQSIDSGIIAVAKNGFYKYLNGVLSMIMHSDGVFVQTTTTTTKSTTRTNALSTISYTALLTLTELTSIQNAKNNDNSNLVHYILWPILSMFIFFVLGFIGFKRYKSKRVNTANSSLEMDDIIFVNPNNDIRSFDANSRSELVTKQSGNQEDNESAITSFIVYDINNKKACLNLIADQVRTLQNNNNTEIDISEKDKITNKKKILSLSIQLYLYHIIFYAVEKRIYYDNCDRMNAFTDRVRMQISEVENLFQELNPQVTNNNNGFRTAFLKENNEILRQIVSCPISKGKNFNLSQITSFVKSNLYDINDQDSRIKEIKKGNREKVNQCLFEVMEIKDEERNLIRVNKNL